MRRFTHLQSMKRPSNLIRTAPFVRRVLRIETVLIIGSLLLTELVLQLGSSVSVTVKRSLAPPWKANKIVVPANTPIGRGNPLRRDHDAWGYRNRAVPKHVEIVTLGDSQTYGGQDPLEAWPQVLSQETGRTVYNMALPGYAPPHSLIQLNDALTLQPNVVIVAPYLGNDFVDAYSLMLKDPRLIDSVSPDMQNAARALEDESPLVPSVTLYRLGGEHLETEVSPLRRWLSDHSTLYGLLRALRNQLRGPMVPLPLLSRHFDTAASALSPVQRQYASAFDGTDWRTILTAPYRGCSVDDRDPRIRLGFEASVQAVLRIAERCHDEGVKTLVVLVPTKENVFWPRVNNPEDHPGLKQLVEDEGRLTKEFSKILELHGIDHVDLVGHLRSAQEQPYYEDADGHPNMVGHTIIAKAIAATLTEITVDTRTQTARDTKGPGSP